MLQNNNLSKVAATTGATGTLTFHAKQRADFAGSDHVDIDHLVTVHADDAWDLFDITRHTNTSTDRPEKALETTQTGEGHRRTDTTARSLAAWATTSKTSNRLSLAAHTLP